ncbi:MAG: hypothetical protein J2P54_22690 [Bradyrhizobiaceae bacterium]|nr:hypothetical protein [Bradyrhizobiaceae bacterium]
MTASQMSLWNIGTLGLVDVVRGVFRGTIPLAVKSNDDVHCRPCGAALEALGLLPHTPGCQMLSFADSLVTVPALFLSSGSWQVQTGVGADRPGNTGEAAARRRHMAKQPSQSHIFAAE